MSKKELIEMRNKWIRDIDYSLDGVTSTMAERNRGECNVDNYKIKELVDSLKVGIDFVNTLNQSIHLSKDD